MSRRSKFRAARVGRATEALKHALETRAELVEEDGRQIYRTNSFHAIRDGAREFQEAAGPIPHDPAEIRRLKSICSECGNSGHRARNCPERTCHKCGVNGHSKVDCPKADA